MSFGIENNILYPPWSLIISLLIINGLYYFGFNISKLIFKNIKYLKINLALSILEKLQVPDGWCSSGLRANEYTDMASAFAPPPELE